MTWFEQVATINKPTLTLVHITDSHVFKEMTGEYFAVNTARNLQRTLAVIAKLECDAVIFGGDLTQDHSEASYHLFANLIVEAGLTNKLYWLPGNHDEIAVYESVFAQYGISHSKVIENQYWQVLLANSKGTTPAGWVEQGHLTSLIETVKSNDKAALVFTHHHPLPIEGYLDKHILENGGELLAELQNNQNVKAVVHGHVHNEYNWQLNELAVFSTPATSIQFEKYTDDWQQCDLGPAFRMIRLNDNGIINTQVVWLDNA